MPLNSIGEAFSIFADFLAGRAWRGLLCAANLIGTPDEGGVDGDIQKNNPGLRCVADEESPVDDAEDDVEQEDGEEGLVHTESHAHDEVVDVGLVGREHTFAVGQPLQGDANHVNAGDEEQGEGGEKCPFAIPESRPAAHLVLDGQVGNDEADEEAARIAHEDFVLSDDAEIVIDEEADDGAAQADGKQDEEWGVEPVEKVGEGQQDDDGEAGGEAVDAVNEVHGVYDEQDAEDGDDVADPEWKFVDAEEAVEVVDHQVAGGENHGCRNLHGKLLDGPESPQVVDEPYQIDEYGADNHQDGGQIDVEFLVDAFVVDGHSHYHSDGGDGHEDDAAQARNGKGVDFAGVGHVVEFLPLAESDDVRNGHQRKDQCGKKGDDDKVIVCVHLVRIFDR